METKRYILAILGGILGGLIASIPWLCLLIFGSVSLSILAFLIPMGVNYGYRKCKGRVNKKLPNITIFTSIIVFLIIILLVLPIWELVLLELPISFKTIKETIFSTSYWRDFGRIIIIAFVFLISGVIKTVNDIKHEIGLYYWGELCNDTLLLIKKKMNLF